MPKIIAKKNFTVENKYYFVGDEINYSDISKPTLINLNEKGFIEPLSIKDIIELENSK